MRENNEAKTYVSNPPQAFDINVVAKALNLKVVGNPETVKAKINIRNMQNSENFQSLSLYTNPLLYCFKFESFLAHAIGYLENQSHDKAKGSVSLKRDELFPVVTNIQEIFKLEFIHSVKIQPQRLEKELALL